MAQVSFYNGSWYVVYPNGETELCHNHATAAYLVKAHNASA
jgi:hypothetical protein